MLCPRRTRDYEDDITYNQTNNKRPSKSARPLVDPSPQQPTGSKIPSRISRLRPPSLERDRCSLLPGSSQKVPRQAGLQTNSTSKLLRPSSYSLTARARTPNTSRYLTPLQVQSIPRQPVYSSSVRKRVLFTGDHNDKNWVQLKMKSIAAYLQEMLKPGSIPGIGPDFFKHGPGLRQMSVKQFSSIINFFLHFIAGNRLSVGHNYIEDIMRVMQKLRYPHTLNKSWLMTPNTPHSIGHVIVLLDYLMKFAPPVKSKLPGQNAIKRLKELPLVGEAHSSSINVSPSQLESRDVEVKKIYLQSTAEAFQLWNIKEDKKLDELVQRTADMIVQKRCNLSSTAALKADLKRLSKKLAHLKANVPQTPHAKEAKCETLRAHRDKLRLELEKCKADLMVEKASFTKVHAIFQDRMAKVRSIEKQLLDLQLLVSKQKYKSQERDEMMEDIELLKQQDQVKDRELVDLREFSVSKQVSLSRIKKEITDLIEEANQKMRHLKYSGLFDDLIANSEYCELSFQPKMCEIKYCVDMLKKMSVKLREMRQLWDKAYREAQMEAQRLRNELQILATKSAQLKIQLVTLEAKRIKLIQNANEMRRRNIQRKAQLEEEIKELAEIVQEQDLLIKIDKEEADKLEKENQALILAMETKHAELLAKRNKRIQMIEEFLDFEEPHLEKLIEKKQESRAIIDKLSEELESLLELE